AGEVALEAGGRGDHRQPDHAVGGGALLQPLHVARVVVLLDVRAAVVGPLQHHGLAPELAERTRAAVGVDGGEGGGRLAHDGRGDGRGCDRGGGGEGQDQATVEHADLLWERQVAAAASSAFTTTPVVRIDGRIAGSPPFAPYTR